MLYKFRLLTDILIYKPWSACTLYIVVAMEIWPLAKSLWQWWHNDILSEPIIHQLIQPPWYCFLFCKLNRALKGKIFDHTMQFNMIQWRATFSSHKDWISEVLRPLALTVNRFVCDERDDCDGAQPSVPVSTVSDYVHIELWYYCI